MIFFTDSQPSYRVTKRNTLFLTEKNCQIYLDSVEHVTLYLQMVSYFQNSMNEKLLQRKDEGWPTAIFYDMFSLAYDMNPYMYLPGLMLLQ